MAITIRLARHGKRNSPYYRIVAGSKGEKRDGKYVEIVGSYNSVSKPSQVTLKEDLVKKWVAQGAGVTQTVQRIISKAMPGLLEEREKHQRSKIQERRKKRKASAKKTTKAPKSEKKIGKTAARKAKTTAKAA